MNTGTKPVSKDLRNGYGTGLGKGLCSKGGVIDVGMGFSVSDGTPQDYLDLAKAVSTPCIAYSADSTNLPDSPYGSYDLDLRDERRLGRKPVQLPGGFEDSLDSPVDSSPEVDRGLGRILVQKDYVHMSKGNVELTHQDAQGQKHFSEFLDEQGDVVRREDYNARGQLEMVEFNKYGLDGEVVFQRFYDVSLRFFRERDETGQLVEKSPDGKEIRVLEEWLILVIL